MIAILLFFFHRAGVSDRIPRATMVSNEYRLVRLRNGALGIRSLVYQETMHPAGGPVAEVDALYGKQLRLGERMATCVDRLVVWDVGLGAGANALALLRSTRDVPGKTQVVSFDNSLAPLVFALKNADALGYLDTYRDRVRRLVSDRRVDLDDGAQNVRWDVVLSDFPAFLAAPAASRLPKPHAILYDPFSPRANPEMWTLDLFTMLYRLLDPCRPCALATYTRSTLVRVTLLLAGFFVGVGTGTLGKEETTIAANTVDLIADPLDQKWLCRAERSSSAEPLHAPIYAQRPLMDATRKKLRAHSQFGQLRGAVPDV